MFQSRLSLSLCSLIWRASVKLCPALLFSSLSLLFIALSWASSSVTRSCRSVSEWRFSADVSVLDQKRWMKRRGHICCSYCVIILQLCSQCWWINYTITHKTLDKLLLSVCVCVQVVLCEADAAVAHRAEVVLRCLVCSSDSRSSCDVSHQMKSALLNLLQKLTHTGQKT